MTLEDAAKYHDEFIKMAVHLGCSLDMAQDVVQNTYVKLGEIQEREGSLARLSFGDDINKGYIYRIIMTQTSNYFRGENKFSDPIENIEHVEDSDIELKIEQEEYMSFVEKELSEIHFYHVKVVEAISREKSLRALSRKTGIGVKSLCNSRKYVKETIEQKEAEKGIKRVR